MAEEGKAVEISQLDAVPVPDGKLPSSNVQSHALIYERLKEDFCFATQQSELLVGFCFGVPDGNKRCARLRLFLSDPPTGPRPQRESEHGAFRRCGERRC